MRRCVESEKIFERACSLFPGGVNSPVRAFRSVQRTPFIVREGKGPYLFDVDGNRYVDYVGSWGPLVLGHAYPAVVEAISHQASRGTSYGACSEPEVELGELIRSLMPSIEMLRFVNSGTEAGMAVLRLARAFTGRELILKFNGCYHGHADSLLVQAGSGVLTLGLPDSPGVVKGAAASTLSAPYNAPDVLEDIFRHHGDRIAAVIVEPVVGNSGFILPQSGFLQTLRSLSTKHGALLIFDEVMTGFRVHKGGAQKHFDIVPDLTMLGKVIGGGLPVGAYGGRADIMKMIAPAGPVYQAGTLSGNPLAMTAGRVTLEEWCSKGHFELASDAAQKLKIAFEEAARRYDVKVQVGVLGTMFGYFFSPSPVHSLEDTTKCDRDRFIHFYGEMLDSGVFFAPSQFEAGFISSSHDSAALEKTAAALNAGFASVAQKFNSQS